MSKVYEYIFPLLIAVILAGIVVFLGVPPPENPALKKLETSIEFQERFIGPEEPGYGDLVRTIHEHKHIPEAIMARIRGITHNASGGVYLALDNDEYRMVAPWDEVRSWD